LDAGNPELPFGGEDGMEGGEAGVGGVGVPPHRQQLGVSVPDP
jgi:hypothetical protein